MNEVATFIHLVSSWIVFAFRSFLAWFINTFIDHDQKIIEFKDLPDVYSIRFFQNGYHYKIFKRDYNTSIGTLYCDGTLVFNFNTWPHDDNEFWKPYIPEHYGEFEGTLLNAARLVCLKFEQELIIRKNNKRNEFFYYF